MTLPRKPHPDNKYSSFAPPTEIKLKRTELKRTKGIRKVSARKAKEKRETDGLRHWYIEAGYPCQICRNLPAVHPHEITAGSHRHRAVYDPDAQIYTCAYCHKCIQGLPYAQQIALRVEAMIDGVNACHGSRAVSHRSVAISLLTIAGD